MNDVLAQLTNNLQNPSAPSLNPFLAMGLGILSEPGHYGNTNMGISRGVLRGMDMINEAEDREFNRLAASLPVYQVLQNQQFNQQIQSLLGEGDIEAANSVYAYQNPGSAISNSITMSKPAPLNRKVTEVGVAGQPDLRQPALVDLQTGGTIPFGDPITKTPMVSNTVNVPKDEQATRVERAKSFQKRFDSIDERANLAQDTLTNLEIARSIDVSTGALEPLKAKVSSLAESLGFDPTRVGLENATNAQAFQGIMQNLVLTKMQAQKGPQTEQDARRVEATVASLGNTPEAKDFLLRSAISLAERDIEKRDFWDDYYYRNGESFKNVEKAWQAHLGKTPLVGKNAKTGRMVFLNEFRQRMRASNPGATDQQITEYWRNNYAK